MKVLVLNASYEALNITTWKRAVLLIFNGKAETLEEGEREVGSVSIRFRIPSVIRMTYYVKKPQLNIPFSRANVFLRDQFTCQYCRAKFEPGALTLDHIIPKSRGGETSWENVVTACGKCNSQKSNRTPEEARMFPRKKPRAPFFAPAFTHHLREEWFKYLPHLVPKAKAG